LPSIGLPSWNGFIGEFLILLGAFLWDARLASLAAVGVILSAVYMLWMFQRVNFGEVANEKNAALPDLTPREWWVLAPAVALAIVMGVVPMVFLRPIEPAAAQVVQRVKRAQPVRVERRSPGFRIEDSECAAPLGPSERIDSASPPTRGYADYASR
jgi:NADH-quinone oxidoreductase subunit M